MKKFLLFFIVLIFILGGGLNFNLHGEDYDWTKVFPTSNPTLGRMGHKLVYDSLRDVIVLFGGEWTNDSEMNDTWEYDGITWIKKNPNTLPRTRDFFGMTYDSNRNVTIVFGGEDWPASLNDTWEYDGTNWNRINTANSPLSRAHINIAYDKIRGKTVLFGGWHWYSTLGDTWEYDGSNWEQKFPVTNPPNRQNNLMVYDEKREVVVMFGGSIHNQSTRYNDTWEWDGENWKEIITATSPSAREEPCGTYDSNRGKVILFGGKTLNGTVNDTWEYDGSDWKRITTVNSPEARGFSSMAYNRNLKTIVLYGGHHGGFQNDTWELLLGSLCTFGPGEQPLQFTRLTGEPVLESVEWESCGGLGKILISNETVSAAYVYLNGEQIFGPSDFNKTVNSLEFEIYLLEGTNVLEVKLMGEPRESLFISFEKNQE